MVSKYEFYMLGQCMCAKQDNLIFQAAAFPANQSRYAVILVSVWSLLQVDQTVNNTLEDLWCNDYAL